MPGYFASFWTKIPLTLFILGIGLLRCTGHEDQIISLAVAVNKRPYELLVLYDRIQHTGAEPSNICRSVSLKQVQQHKGLSRTQSDYLEESGDAFHDHHQAHESDGISNHSKLRFLRAYSFKNELLVHKVDALCGTIDTWNFPVSVAPHVQPLLADTSSDARQVAFSAVLKQPHIPPPPIELIPLILSGDSSNRVDLVFLSDGYTEEERLKFIADSLRLAGDISNNETFSTVRPLMNFWAAFSPSNESGIGAGGKPKDTVYGLYRDGTELRGVYWSKMDVAMAACTSLGDKCDYPILLGNDPLYGGLGGTFTVTTSSLTNGALVLRHELGHSVIDVGEEYDGGYAYFGVNAAANLSSPFPWTHWLTENTTTPKSERSVMPIQAYPWTLLNLTDPWSASFNSSGTYSRFVVRFSLSGIPQKDHLKVTLDGVDLNWNPRQDIGIDRWHYDLHQDFTLTPGEHNISFSLGQTALAGVAQLCSVEVIEFGNSEEFHATPGFIGAFPSFSDKNQTSFRPTNEDCLMRIVTTPNFCKVCLEGLWMSLLKRVDLIENIQSGCRLTSDGQVKRTVEIALVPLAHLREDAQGIDEVYVIHWSINGKPLNDFVNQSFIEVDNILGTFSVEAEFVSTEIRVDENNYTKSIAEIDIRSTCFTGV